MRLARVGIENVRGYHGGRRFWRGRTQGCPALRTEQISAQELNRKLQRLEFARARCADVRREGEWQAGHIRGVRMPRAG